MVEPIHSTFYLDKDMRGLLSYISMPFHVLTMTSALLCPHPVAGLSASLTTTFALPKLSPAKIKMNKTKLYLLSSYHFRFA